MDKDNINTITEYLFNRSHDEELTEEQEDALLDSANNQIENYGWEATFNSWENYLYHKCITPEDAINFALLFWGYGGQDHIIKEPHKFIAYFYYRINYDTETYDSQGILDSIAITILPKAGFSEADIGIHTDYVPESDPLIIKEVNKYIDLSR